MIIRAGKQDLERVRAFLTKAQLGTDGLTEETVDYFLLLEDEGGNVRGSLGIEAYKEHGLLRSLVVSPGQAEKEIFVLFNQMLKLAREKGITSLFLATNKSVAVPFFEVLGFNRIEQEDLPNDFDQSEHIQHILNVDNSIFLKFSL
jgi:N-acetylglutamate synthase-like GNAT family acetyltransferase